MIVDSLVYNRSLLSITLLFCVFRHFVSSMQIMLERVEPCDIGLLPTLPKLDNLAKQANHKRRKCRPRHPVDLLFDIDQEHLPEDFLQGDVAVDGRRHLVFATIAMLTLLSQAYTW